MGRGKVWRQTSYMTQTCAPTRSRTEIAGRGNSQQLSNSSLLVSSDIFGSSSGPHTNIFTAYTHARHPPLPFLCACACVLLTRGLQVTSIFRPSIKAISRCDSCVCLWVCAFLFGSRMCVDVIFIFSFAFLSMCMSFSLFLSSLLTSSRYTFRYLTSFCQWRVCTSPCCQACYV